MSKLGSSWQFTLALVTSILVFGGGTVLVMALGHDVPAALWSIDGALASALVSHGAFFTQRAMGMDSMSLASQVVAAHSGAAVAPVAPVASGSSA